MIHKIEMTQSEIQDYIQSLRRNALQCMNILIEQVQVYQIEFSNDEARVNFNIYNVLLVFYYLFFISYKIINDNKLFLKKNNRKKLLYYKNLMMKKQMITLLLTLQMLLIIYGKMNQP